MLYRPEITEFKQEGGRKKKTVKQKDVSHIAVVIYILEVLLGLLHWTGAVTDVLAICPAAKLDAQQPAVPATAKHPSPHTTEPPRDAAASWALRGAQGPSASSKVSAPRQHFGHQLPPAWRRDTQKGPSKEGRCGKGEVLVDLHSSFVLGTGPPSCSREEQSIVPGHTGGKEQMKSRDRQQDVIESPKYH